TFVVTNSVAGKVLSGRGYREYRLGDYSNWLQNRVNDHWGRVRSYLVDSNICQRLLQAGSTPVDDFYREHLSALQLYVAGKVLSGRGYREYRLGDYSNWLQNRVNDHWGQVRSYLVDSNICQRLLQAGSTPVDDFYREHLSALQV
ncbi:ATP-dependent Clp protease proteolytic subunit, partial [Striga asiatica]